MRLKFIFGDRRKACNVQFVSILQLRRFVGEKFGKKESDLLLCYLDEDQELMLLVTEEDFKGFLQTTASGEEITVIVRKLREAVTEGGKVDQNLISIFFLNELSLRFSSPSAMKTEQFDKHLKKIAKKIERFGIEKERAFKIATLLKNALKTKFLLQQSVVQEKGIHFEKQKTIKQEDLFSISSLDLSERAFSFEEAEVDHSIREMIRDSLQSEGRIRSIQFRVKRAAPTNKSHHSLIIERRNFLESRDKQD